MTEKLRIEVLLAAIDKVTGPLRQIVKGSGETARALRAAKDQLKALGDQRAHIAAFKEADKAAAITANAFKSVQERVKLLKAEMDKAPTDKLARTLKTAQAEADTLRKRHEHLMDKQQRLFAQMKAGGLDVHNLADESRRLATAQIEAGKAADQLKVKLEAQNKTLARIHAAKANYEKSIAFRDKLAGASVGLGIAGAAISAPAGLALKNFATLETAETLLRTSMMDASGNIDASFERIKDKAIELGNTLPGTTRDFLNAARELKQQGMNSSSVVNGGLTASSYLGVRFGLDQTRTAEFIAKAREAHGLRDDDLPKAADYMHRAREAFGLRHDDIYEAMKYAATDLNLKNQVGDMGKMKEYLVLQGIAGQAGLEGSTFGTNFSHMLKQMAAISRDAKSMKGALGNYVSDLLDAKGIKFNFYDKNGNFGGFEKMFNELSKLNGLSPVDQELVLKKLFDTEGARVAGLILKKGLAGYKASMAQMENVASLESVIEEMQKTLEYQQENFAGNLENLSAMMGAHLKPFAIESLETLNKLINWVREFNKEHPGMVGGIVKVGAGLGTLLLVISGGAAAITAFLGPLALAKMTLATLGATGVLGTVIAGIKALGLAVLMSPIAPWLLLLGAVGALIYANWGPLKEFLGSVFDYWAEKFRTFHQFVVTFPERFKTVGSAIMRGLADGILGGFTWVKDAVGGIADSTVGWLKDKLGIRSPSRVFAEIGGFAMAGFEEGILRGTDAPLAALAGAVKRLTAGGAGLMIGGAALATPPDVVRNIDEIYRPAALREVGAVSRLIDDRHRAIELPTPPDVVRHIDEIYRPSALRAVGDAADAPDVRQRAIDTRTPLVLAGRQAPTAPAMIVQITINAAPGMSEQGIARQVADELRRLDRDNAARARSRLRDMD